jgi:hypothetical protein
MYSFGNNGNEKMNNFMNGGKIYKTKLINIENKEPPKPKNFYQI